MNKTCTKCGESKPSSEFGIDARKRDGRRPNCKVCVNAYNVAWRAKNPEKQKAIEQKRYLADTEKRKASAAKWRAANKDKHKENGIKWQSNNREKVNSYAAKYRAENREKCSIATAKWNAANPEYVRINAHNRRARKREVGGTLSKGLASKLFKLQRGKCACGCKQSLGDDYHLDHIIPLALGGSNTDDNIQLLRSTCNLQKNKKHPIEFMQAKGYLL